MAAADLLAEAENNLRCIAWVNFTRALMSSSVGSQEDFQRLSRPVLKGEQIDFFLSHSWHDNPDVKYDALEAVVAKFIQRYRREPTFWLDKVCIEQGACVDAYT